MKAESKAGTALDYLPPDFYVREKRFILLSTYTVQLMHYYLIKMFRMFMHVISLKIYLDDFNLLLFKNMYALKI